MALTAVGTQSPGALFRPRRIGHVNFWSNDSQATAAFYGEIVGIGVAYRREAIKAVFMTNGNTYHDVAFMDLRSPRGAGHVPGLHHFSFEVETERDLVNGFEAVRKEGFEFDFTISADVTNSAYGSDPDGNRFELYADVVEDWKSRRSGEVTTGAIPWTPGATPPIEKPLHPVDPEITTVPDAVFHPQRCSHVVLVTRNHAAMVDHYTRIAGLHVLSGSIDGPVVLLGGSVGEETLALVRSNDGETTGLHHFGLEMADDQALDEAKAELSRRGLAPFAEIDVPSRRSLYLRDPDGVLIQFHVTRAVDHAGWAALPPDLMRWVV